MVPRMTPSTSIAPIRDVQRRRGWEDDLESGLRSDAEQAPNRVVWSMKADRIDRQHAAAQEDAA